MAVRPLTVAILGATGAVGKSLVQALEESDLPVGELRLVATERSAGAELDFRGDLYRAQAVGERSFDGVHLAFLAAGAGASRTLAPRARAAGAVAIDLSPAFRGLAEVPLALPELSAEALGRVPAGGLVAIPGPAAAHLALALAPLHRGAGVERASTVVLEAVSAAGQRGVEELENELRAMLSLQRLRCAP